jgi:tRNA A-37 threonylcarbamoyl transferase component Bud32
MPPAARGRLVSALAGHVFGGDAEFRRYGGDSASPDAPGGAAGPVYFIFAVEDDPHQPDDVFARLRWGGQFVYASRDRRRAVATADHFAQRGYEIVRGPTLFRRRLFGVLPGLGRRIHYFAARKTQLILPRQLTDRFSYHVHLIPAAGRTAHADDWIVCKEIPTLERVAARLKARFPDLSDASIERRARKFTDKVFPLFLTREAAILKILRRELPIEFLDRVPHVIEMDRDERGYVRVLRMNWLRNSLPKGGKPLTQLQFARQSTELLAALHDGARVIHLDLRLDNIVITEHGVGFVDFGSSTRVAEDLSAPLLSSIFTELMRTSQIQHMMASMSKTGRLTSSAIMDGYQKVDRAVDFFYLAVQINNPLANPDFQGLVEYDPKSEEAKALAHLTHDILKPPDPSQPLFRSAQDILAGIERVEQSLYGGKT